MQKIIEEKELGKVVLKKKIRARNYTIRIKRGEVTVTLPFYGSYKKAMEFVLANRNQLLIKIKDTKSRILSAEQENELKLKASQYLPSRLNFLASKHGFCYTSVKIRKSRTRWGSCSSSKTINLSIYLMILPEHLVDYVLLHELCHTVHMNHGSEFWLLLDQITGNQAKALNKALKNYRLP